MKFLYKIIVTMSFIHCSWARDVILLENTGSDKNGEMVISILEKKFGIPRKLIVYKKKLKCSQNSEAIMQLCVRADGEMDIVKMNKLIVEETLGSFNDKEMM